MRGRILCLAYAERFRPATGANGALVGQRSDARMANHWHLTVKNPATSFPHSQRSSVPAGRGRNRAVVRSVSAGAAYAGNAGHGVLPVAPSNPSFFLLQRDFRPITMAAKQVEEHRRKEDAEERHAQHAAEDGKAERGRFSPLTALPEVCGVWYPIPTTFTCLPKEKSRVQEESESPFGKRTPSAPQTYCRGVVAADEGFRSAKGVVRCRSPQKQGSRCFFLTFSPWLL